MSNQQAIWVNKTSKGFTVWAQSMPSYSIPNNQGLYAAIKYFNSKKDEWDADNWDNGIGTFLGTIEGDRDRILCEIEDTIPKVSNVVKGRIPVYLIPLYILSTTTPRTEDSKASYQIAKVNKFPKLPSDYDSIYLVLDKHNNYRGFADSEYRACELAELIVKKPIPQPAIIQR